ncbi:MAG TPA: carbamoyl-phosphate synthase large subunit [Candidatus Latescibacteria bacterium]|jgi:carbamoyl-phosphate synthase large subunit|nr:carbamoyl-phosphate synthase large subunit [Candidatus Latescibacterota bacterium]HJP32967.1 carbamoyl-phosphate synthase large subunit [Candidatus Latescibacterota bacterium]
MPRRDDIKKIMLIGSGPIVIGQACEFDYSGTQACKALREEGYEIVLVNSNPATIMTDPEMADRTYIEPITEAACAKIIEAERPDAMLPTVGGQTALNVAVELSESGVLERYGVQLIGARLEAIKTAEDRELFKQAMDDVGLDMPRGYFVHTIEEAQSHQAELGYPIIIRPSFTMGGSGGGIAYNAEEFDTIVSRGLDLSPITELLIEESVLGWKEYELEVMRDMNDNVVIICSIENFDAMGVHTGDSITVAPAQTLSDKEYQVMRDAAIRIIRRIGVDTGGSNIQFAVDPATGRMTVIEMNPRVSRSSALASKATGFPIAKIAAKLAVGYSLDEIRNDITRETPASFEPTIDYVVTKIPRWAFEKFPSTPDALDTQMRSVGETMAIGRTFAESFQKGLRSLEIGRAGWGADGKDVDAVRVSDAEVREHLVRPNSQRAFYIRTALQKGFDVDEIQRLTHIDPWFLDRLVEIFHTERDLTADGADPLADQASLRRAKEEGFSDRQLAHLTGRTEVDVRRQRIEMGVRPVFKTVDTCAAEFEAHTPYHYSTYELENEAVPTTQKRKVMILGGGPNRIGQGIEFDYCCVHACFALREDGFETIMVNSNPETVSTDYDTADKLYFEPLTVEDVLHIVEQEEPEGVIVQFGGQTPLNLALELEANGVPIIGTSPSSIDRAEDREHFGNLLKELGILQPENGMARSLKEAREVAARIGFPVLVRPSYVLGGRAMVTVYDETRLDAYMESAISASPGRPVLIDRFLDGAQEFDVDAVCDGEDVLIGGVMQHIEHAGVHSGDSACVLPAHDISDGNLDLLRRHTRAMALALDVKGLMNVQYAIHDDEVYVLEVNPRASRTVPFVSKATGKPLAKIAARVMVGQSLCDQGLVDIAMPAYISVKEAVLPFNKFPGADGILGPEMKSTGEVMGVGSTFGEAFLKAQMGAGSVLPSTGKVFISVNDRDKVGVVDVARRLHEAGFQLVATDGTRSHLESNGIPAEKILKIHEGRPHVEDAIRSHEVVLVVNSPLDEQSQHDDLHVRRAAIMNGVPYTTTLAGATAAAAGIEANLRTPLSVKALQDYHRD